jgi:hypothetical protein
MKTRMRSLLKAQKMRSTLIDQAEHTAAKPVVVTKGTPLAQASERYFVNLEARGLDAKSVRTYHTGVDPFVQICMEACAEDVTNQDMIDFMGWRRKQPLPKRRISKSDWSGKRSGSQARFGVATGRFEARGNPRNSAAEKGKNLSSQPKPFGGKFQTSAQKAGPAKLVTPGKCRTKVRPILRNRCCNIRAGNYAVRSCYVARARRRVRALRWAGFARDCPGDSFHRYRRFH